MPVGQCERVQWRGASIKGAAIQDEAVAIGAAADDFGVVQIIDQAAIADAGVFVLLAFGGSVAACAEQQDQYPRRHYTARGGSTHPSASNR